MIKIHDLSKVYRTADVETTALNQDRKSVV